MTTNNGPTAARRRRPLFAVDLAARIRAMFLLFVVVAAATSILFSLLLSVETSLLSKPITAAASVVFVSDNEMTIAARDDGVTTATLREKNYYYDYRQQNRQLRLSMSDEVIDTTTNKNDAILGQSISGGGVIVNMLRRARDKVDEKDVPFLLQVPYTNSDVIYKIMTECYGLVGREYWDVNELKKDKDAGLVDQFYVSSHDRPKEVSFIDEQQQKKRERGKIKIVII